MINHYPLNNRLFSELDRFVTQALSQTDDSNCDSSECAVPENENSEDANANGWSIRLELPGFKKEELSISVDEDFLKINAETSDESRNFLNAVERRVRISEEVDSDNIDARLEDGLLYLHLPRRARLEPRKVTVN